MRCFIQPVLLIGTNGAQVPRYPERSHRAGRYTRRLAHRAGIVHLEGAIKTAGTNQVAFTLPAGFRPAHNVYVKVGLCNSTNGRLWITPSGSVTVQAGGGNWFMAQCLTSLDGASFAR